MWPFVIIVVVVLLGFGLAFDRVRGNRGGIRQRHDDPAQNQAEAYSVVNRVKNQSGGGPL